MNSIELAKRIRIDVLHMVHNAHASHIGSAFSIADVLAVLYADILKYDVENPKWAERDRVVLSKGHAGSALYAVLGEVGFFDKEQLNEYGQNGSPFSEHISHKGIPGIELSTGSLGHGVCVATGMALAAKIDAIPCRVYAIVGDGECDEGSFWETVMFANQYNLSNFTVIIDRNNMQAMGNTDSVISTGDLAKKISEFGWNALTIDGNNHPAILSALQTKFDNGKPVCIVANTIKGKGVSFMENQLIWHYRDPQGEFYEKALEELGGEKK